MVLCTSSILGKRQHLVFSHTKRRKCMNGWMILCLDNLLQSSRKNGPNLERDSCFKVHISIYLYIHKHSQPIVSTFAYLMLSYGMHGSCVHLVFQQWKLNLSVKNLLGLEAYLPLFNVKSCTTVVIRDKLSNVMQQ